MLKEGFFDKIYYRYWEVDNKLDAIANVFVIHGLGGHSIWFDQLAKVLNQNNINCFSFDLPGFGQSKYPKGEIDSYMTWVDTTKEVLKNFLLQFQVMSPVFILGHSMGALIAILLNEKVKANGWILSVPGFEGDNRTFPFLSFTLPTLFKALTKSKETVILPFGPELLTKNKKTQNKLKKDPLRVINVSAELLKHVYFLGMKTKRSHDLLNEPVVMLLAGKDTVCSNQASERFYNEIKAPDKSKKIYTESLHDLLVEDEINQIAQDIADWAKLRVSI